MASVNQIDEYGFQARVFRGGKVVWQRYFAIKEWRGKNRARNAAINQAQQIEIALPPQHRECRSNTGVLGISKTSCTRNRNDKTYIEDAYQVQYRRYKISRKFYIGRRGEYSAYHDSMRLLDAAAYLRTRLDELGVKY